MSLSIAQKRWWIVLIVLQIFLVWTIISFKPIYAVGIILGIGCLFYLLWGSDQLPKAILLTILISVILLETRRKFLIKIEEFPIIFVAGFFLLNQLLGNKNNTKIGPIGKWLTLFLFVVVLSTVMGLHHGRSFRAVGGEFIVYFYYLLFFFVIKSDFSEKWMKYLIYTVIGATFLISIGYIGLSIATGGGQRCTSDQQHMLNIGIPLAFGWLLYEKKGWRKAILGLMLIPMGFAVLVTFTRMLWASIPLSLLLVLFLYLRREKISIRYFLYAVVSVSAIVLFLLFPIKGLLEKQEALHYAIKNRITSLTQLKTDPSFLGRAEVISYILPRIQKHPILGVGLGDVVSYRAMPAGAAIYSLAGEEFSYKFTAFHKVTIPWIDVSYFNVLWKMGITGLFLFIGLYIVFINRCWFVFKNTTNNFEKWSSLGIFVSFIELLFISFLSPILVQYRFNLTWAALMGIIELQAQRIEHKIQN